VRRILWIAPVLSVAVIAVAIVAFNLGLFHAQMENWLSEMSGSKVQLGAVALIPRWPPTLQVETSRLERENASLSWRDLRIELASLTKPYALIVTVFGPKLTLDGPLTAPAQSASHGGGSGPTRDGALVSLRLKIEDGDITTPNLHLKSVGLALAQKNFLNGPAKVYGWTIIQTPGFSTVLPVTIDGQFEALSTHLLRGSDLKLTVFGLQAALTGSSDWDAGQHHWTLALAAPDLAKVPHPADEVVVTDQWRGSMQLNAEIAKAGRDKDWAAEADLQAADVSAVVKLKAGTTMVQGPVGADASVHFIFADGGPIVPHLKGTFDFTSAHVLVENYIEKAPSVPLKIKIEGQGDAKAFHLQDLSFSFWAVNAQMKGSVGMAAPHASDLSFEIPDFELKDADKVLLPLAKSPASGTMAARGRFTGDLADAREAHWQLQYFKAKDFSAEFNFEQPGVCAVKGPAEFSLEGSLDLQKHALARINLAGQFDVSKAAVAGGPLRKEAGQALSGELQLKSTADLIEVGKLNLKSFAGQMSVSGKIQTPRTPKLNLQAELKDISLSELRVALPALHERMPKGDLNAKLNLYSGPGAGKSWDTWPFNLAGSFSADVFDGHLAVTKFNATRLGARPVVQGHAAFTGLSIEQTLGYVKPRDTDLASGKMTGVTDFFSYLPNDDDFLSFLKAKGEAVMKPVTLNSVKIGAMLNDLVKQVPMIKMKPVEAKPFKGSVELLFDLQKQMLQVDRLVARDEIGSELQMKGNIKLPQAEGDLAGTFFWAKSEVKGCLLEANSDANGRMIIPLALTGELMHPNLASISGLVTQLGARALACEGKKIDLNKTLKNLFGH